MHEYIAPSIAAYCRETEYDLSNLYADTLGEGRLDTGKGPEEIMGELVAQVKAYASTTNGGYEFYIDDWTSIPWCSEEDKNLWHS
jgi:hypothetical protein